MKKIKVKIQRYKKSAGFVAIFVVMSAILMTTLVSIGTFSAVLNYQDSVWRRQYRLQASLNAQSCVQLSLLAFAHDYFY
ncbi:MAG: hypothetical protein KGJ35_03665, partial [Patescibacteria group bacterium]|nr:hypothetical protein [Patescibacteria group bacterium]